MKEEVRRIVAITVTGGAGKVVDDRSTIFV